MEIVTLIGLGLKLAMPWLAKKFGGKKKVRKAIEIALELFQQANDQFTGDQDKERKRFVMGELAKDQTWTKLDESERDMVMEYSYRSWKWSLNPANMDDEDEANLGFKLRIALEALRVHGHNEIADGLAEELGR
jgi:hypothetical protein